MNGLTRAYDGGHQKRERRQYGGSIVLGKKKTKNVLSLDLKDSREGFFQKGRGEVILCSAGGTED